MFLEYPLFYRQHGIRTVLHLFKARTTRIQNLPKFSLLHWARLDALAGPLSEEDLDAQVAALAIDKDYFLFQEYRKFFYVDYTTEFTSPEPVGRRKSIVVLPLLKRFHLKNRRYLFMKDAAKLIDNPMALVIQHYDYLHLLYRYMANPLMAYHRWHDYTSTFYDTVARLCQESQRHQFFVLDVPDAIPSYAVMGMYEKREPSTSLLKIFDDPYKLFILDLYKFLDPETRSQSLLSRIPPEHYGKFNFVFRTPDGLCSILNLGYLNSFIKGQPNSTDLASLSQVAPSYLRKMFIIYLNQLRSALMKDQAITPDLIMNEPDLTNTDDAASAPNETLYANDAEDEVEVVRSTSVDLEPEIDPILAEQEPDEVSDDITVDLTQIEKEVDDIVEQENQSFQRDLQRRQLEISKTGEVKALSGEVTHTRYLEQLEKVNQLYFEPNDDVRGRIEQRAKTLLDSGFLTTKEYNSYIKSLSETRLKPVDVSQPLKTGIQLPNAPIEASYTNNSIDNFNQLYDEAAMTTDIENMILHVQRAYVNVKMVEKTTITSVLGDYDRYSLTIDPIDGAQSTIHLKVPKLDKDGYFYANGKKNILRKQIVDMPIRKISPTRVQLSSYYGKTFITRSRTKSDSYIYKVIKRINATVNPDAYITRIALGDYFTYDTPYPYVLGQLAAQYLSIETQEFILDFRHELLKAQLQEHYESAKKQKGLYLTGYYKNGDLLYIDDRNQFFRQTAEGRTPVGNIAELLKLEISRSEIYSDYATMRIYSKEIPVALILLYFMGIDVLLNKLKVKYELVPMETIKQLNKEAYAYVIPFQDQALCIFEQNTSANILLLAGLYGIGKPLLRYKYADLNVNDSIADLFFHLGFNATYLKEIESQEALFIDPITKSVLESIKEPTLYLSLLIRANELLVDYTCMHPQNIEGMRIRGNERIAGFIYKELSYAIRDFRNRNISYKSKVEISPYKVWDTITKDNAVKLAEETNPIHALKEKEIITYVGEGGRSKESMPKNTRVFHKSFAGVVSEASVDSSDVGINAYLSPGANIKNIRGVIEQPQGDRRDLSSMISTSALLAPFSLNDDPKRINFINIQNSHVVACPHYSQPYVMTGYEQVVPRRESSHLFSTKARMKGVVESLTDKLIVIKYEDGSLDEIEIGTLYGRSEGKTYSHQLQTDLKVGDTVNKDDVLSYNKAFFTKDPVLNDYVYKSVVMARVALMESYQTHEDSSAISETFAKKLHTDTIEERSIVVSFNQRLSQVKRIGDETEVDTPLMVIEDELSSNLGIFTDAQLSSLSELSKQVPKAKYRGIIENVEVYYHGEKDDMSPELKKLAQDSDARLKKKYHSKKITGYADDSYQVSGTPLQFQTAEIRYFIRKNNKMGVGDKVIFANQMKSVIGEVLKYPVRDDMGNEIDALFGMRSIANRIVLSPFLIGTTSTLLRLVGQRAVSIFEGK